MGAPVLAGSAAAALRSSGESEVALLRRTLAEARLFGASASRPLAELYGSKAVARESTFRMSGGTVREECCCARCGRDCTHAELDSDRWDVFSTLHTAFGCAPPCGMGCCGILLAMFEQVLFGATTVAPHVLY